MSEAIYDRFARFYDDVLGNAESSVSFIQDLIKKYNPLATEILELGCGTGIYLNALKGKYKLTGIDLSERMLEIAREKIPEGNFFKMNIGSFKLNRSFDIILCLYDTLNHITKFAVWEKIFSNVRDHLNEEGIFIFDVNTISKLRYFAQSPPYVHQFNNNFLILDVKKNSYIYNWNLKIFENLNGNNYKLTEADVPQVSFETVKIDEVLSRYYKILKIIETEKIRSGEYKFPGRIFFICKKQRKK